MSPLSVEGLGRLGMAAASGMVAIGLVWLLCRFLPRLSPMVRHWLWWLACLKLLVGLIALPAVPLSFLPAAAPSVAPVAPMKVAQRAAPAQSAEVAQAPTAVAAAQQVVDKPVVPHENVGLWLVFPVLLGVWLVGVGVGIGGQVMGLWQLRRLAAAGEVCESRVLWEAVRRANLPHLPTLCVVPSPVEPLTMAAPGRPLILIARDDVERLSDEELLPVLTHECLHIRRGDLLLSLVPWLAQTLFWFLPPVYLAMREFELAREAACDGQTMAALALSPQVYGELIVKLSSPVSPIVTPASAMALSAGFRQMKRRIEMLRVSPKVRPSRALLALTTLAVTAALIPYRLTPTDAALPVKASETAGELPNLDLANGLAHWKRMANGTDTVQHPYFEVGIDRAVQHAGHPAGFIRSKGIDPEAASGDGGVFRYDITGDAIRKYQGKRVRLSAFVLTQKATTGHVLLFNAMETATHLLWVQSSEIKAGAGWQRLECTMEVPKATDGLSIGLRFEGSGTVYGSEFHLETVGSTVPLSPVKDISRTSEMMSPPNNLVFANGIDGWWNDNPTHDTAKNYAIAFEPHGGRNGGPAALLHNLVSNPHSYGTLAQNADPSSYAGKRVRFSAYLKTEDAEKAELWIVLADKTPQRSSASNADTTGQVIRGTTGWTKQEYIVDVPKTTNTMSFGIASTGKGKVWVDGFQFEVLGPLQK